MRRQESEYPPPAEVPPEPTRLHGLWAVSTKDNRNRFPRNSNIALWLCKCENATFGDAWDSQLASKR